MKKQDVINSVLVIANRMGLNGYNVIASTTTLPELSKMIAYDMFVNNLESFGDILEDEVKQSIKCVREYSKELKSKGFVEFK